MEADLVDILLQCVFDLPSILLGQGEHLLVVVQVEGDCFWGGHEAEVEGEGQTFATVDNAVAIKYDLGGLGGGVLLGTPL